MRTGMPRPRRIRIAGVSQHITQRGSNRMATFRSDSDYRMFLTLIRQASTRCGSEVHGYVLMTNHIHLLLTPRVPTAVEKTMQLLGTRYAGYFNRRHHRTGPVFEGRYKTVFVDDERYWITCLRYIELNPVRAGVVSTPEEYIWSSYHANALGNQDDLVTPHARYLALGSVADTRQCTWRSLCATGLSDDELDRIRFGIFERRILETASVGLPG